VVFLFEAVEPPPGNANLPIGKLREKGNHPLRQRPPFGSASVLAARRKPSGLSERLQIIRVNSRHSRFTRFRATAPQAVRSLRATQKHSRKFAPFAVHSLARNYPYRRRLRGRVRDLTGTPLSFSRERQSPDWQVPRNRQPPPTTTPTIRLRFRPSGTAQAVRSF
jgi:hypothetical protein